MARSAISLSVAALCLLASTALRAQPSEPPEFRATVAAYQRADYGAALPLLRIQAADGYPPSQYLLALLYLSGDGVPRNEPAAAFWLHKAVLKDHSLSQYALAVMLDEGLGIDTDQAVARVLLDHAALRGVAAAQMRVRIMSAPIGTDKEELEAADRLAALDDKNGAFLHRLRAARLGNAQAQYAVGLAYLLAEGTGRLQRDDL